MSKLLGALLVLAGGLIWALLSVKTGRKRMECLTQLASDLERLSCELDTGDRPLPELIHMLSENGGVQSRDFFVRLENSLWRMGDVEFRSLWREAAERCSVPLNRTERYALGNLEPDQAFLRPGSGRRVDDHSCLAVIYGRIHGR